MHYKVPLVITVALLSCAAIARSQLALEGDDHVVFMNDEHPAMRKSVARARAELDGFLAIAQAPAKHQVGFALKVGLREGDNVEYVWIVNFKADKSGNFTGVINNEIEMDTHYKLGDQYSFRKADIVDWMYLDKERGKMHGNYTLCALLTQEPPDDAAKVIEQYQLDCTL